MAYSKRARSSTPKPPDVYDYPGRLCQCANRTAPVWCSSCFPALTIKAFSETAASTPHSPAKNFTSPYSKRPQTSTPKPPDEYEYPEYPEYVLPTPPPDPCTLFWDDECLRVGFNPFTVEIAVVLLLTLPHISMIIFLILQGRRESAFRGSFYVLFVAVSVVDCLRMALLISDKLVDATNSGLYGMNLLVARHIIYIIPTYAQSMLHLLIAVNRFTAFFYPLDQSTIWSNRVTAATIVAVAALSVLLHVVPFYLLPLFYTGSLFPVESDDGSWDPVTGYQKEIDKALNALVCLMCAIVGFVMSITTIVKLRTLARSGQLRESGLGRDMKLLFQSTFMISMQVFLSVPIFVITVRNSLSRLFLDYDFFTDMWNTFLEPFHLFAFYVTNERLAEILSLSGTPFLLLISNNVRSAYCQFYFKRSSAKSTNAGTTQSNQGGGSTRSTLFSRRSNL